MTQMAGALLLDRWTQRLLSALAIAFAGYMIYATFYGPYRTTLVHLALFLIVMMVIYFLDHEQTAERPYRWPRRLWNWTFAGLATVNGRHCMTDACVLKPGLPASK